jgi:hypothetical protein
MRFVRVALVGLALGGFIRPLNIACAQAPVASGTIITIAGNGSHIYAGDGRQATAAGMTPYSCWVPRFV